MDPNLSLRAATVQELQLELIRRTQFNSFDGEVVCAVLAEHRALWRSALLDRTGVPNYSKPGPSALLTGGLIKLRDLEDDFWNADRLFVLTHDNAGARTLAAAFEELGGMSQVHEDREATDRALGWGREEHGLVTSWWD